MKAQCAGSQKFRATRPTTKVRLVTATMTLQQVHYFLTLCDEQNFSRAAARCEVRKPSLTNAIKQLERELGGPLFVRNRRMSRLSNLGAAVKPHLERFTD
jgi:LysR family hydrogen peroxide-inducible transcriptional activator